MILKVNLAPEISHEATLRDLSPALLAVLVVVGGAYYLPTLYADSLKKEAQDIEQKTAERRQQLTTLQADLNKAKALQAMVGELEARRKVIDGVANGRRQPVAVLEKLQDIHMERMWITNLDFKQNVMTIKGWATEHNVISEYARRIKVTNNADDLSGIDTKTFKPTFQEAGVQKSVSETNKNSTDLASVKFTDLVLKEAATKENAEAANMPIQNFELQFNPNLSLR